MKKVFYLILACLLSSCAFGTKMNLAETQLNLSPNKLDTFSVVVWDARPYVLSGEKSPEWIGLQRSGWGIPYGVHTSSGATLAQDFSRLIGSNFSRAGVSINSNIAAVPGTKSREQALTSIESGKKLLVTINQWKSDTMADVSFEHDILCEVISKDGKTLVAEKSFAKEVLEGGFWNPIAASEKSVVAKQKLIMEDLLNRASIVEALK